MSLLRLTGFGSRRQRFSQVQLEKSQQRICLEWFFPAQQLVGDQAEAHQRERQGDGLDRGQVEAGVEHPAGGQQGAALLLFGHLAPWLFCAAFAVFAIVEASLRPLSTNILLSEFRDAGGTTASAINFTSMVQGSLGMLLVGALGTDYVSALAWTILGSMVVAALGWQAFLRRYPHTAEIRA